MRKLLVFFLCMIWAGSFLHAQSRTVSGRVTDEAGNPLVGATVAVVDGTARTTTNTSGNFSITVPANARQLEITYVGQATQRVSITNEPINVTMAAGKQQLEEVVVTALGIARDKRSLGYATQSLKNEDIVDRGEINVVNALQGKIAGVDITGASGAAGASANINIRGITSFGGSNQPLFVVDGIPISNDVDRTGTVLNDQQPPNRALDLNLNDIESINVLKGPSAAVLYGSRASSGAIIITTKRGTAGRGKVRVTLSSSYTSQRVVGLPEFQNEYGGGTNGLYNATSTFSFGPKFGSTPSLLNGLLTTSGQVIDYKAYPSNIQDFFEMGNILENNLSLSGGDVKQNFNFSIGNASQKGIIPNSLLNRTNVGVKFNSELSDKFTLGASVNYISSRQLGSVQGNGAQSALFQLYSVPRSFDLQFYKTNYKKPDGSNNWPLNSTRDNPYFAAYEDPVTSRLTRTIANTTLGYQPFAWLNISYRLGVDAYTDRRKRVTAIGSNAASGLGRIEENNFFRSELNGDLLITAKKNDLFAKGINATFLVGQNINNRVFQNIEVQGDNLSVPGFYNVSGATQFNSSGESNTTRRLLGYYGQASFGYNNYLFLELTGRADQSSTLPKNNNTYFYPSISTSFVFTDAFDMKSSVLTYGKIRASAAKVGRDADPYLLDNTFVSWDFGNNVASVTFPFTGITGFGASSRIAPINLTPEFTTSSEVGLNLGFFKNRLTIDAAYFTTVSKNQILNVGIPVSTGYNTFTTNLGEMTNKGIELLVSGTPINTRNFRWETNANFTRIRNKVVSIGQGIKNFPIPGGSQFTGVTASIVEGQPYGVIVGNKWQRSPDGQMIINPATGTPLQTVAGQIISDPNRDFLLGVTNSFKYKNLSMSFLVDYKQGGDIISWSISSFRAQGNLKVTGEGRDLPFIFPGVIQTADGKFIPNNIQINYQSYWNSMSSGASAGDFGVFDATTLRLREVTFGIDVKNRIFQNARFTVFGRNLFYYAPNVPIDPEVSTQGASNFRGTELQSAPSTRNFGASFRITF